MKIFPTLVFFLLIINGFTLQAQSGKGWMIEPTLHYGKLIKHTPKLNFEVEQPSYGLEVAFRKQTLGEKEWHQWQNFPIYGISAMYFKLGDPSFLGSAWSLTPNIGIYIRRRQKYDVQFLFGYGLAYLTKPFDYTNNPINNAIGSHINTTVQLRFAYHYHLSNRLSLKGGLSFTHYSNGASALPNFGLNIPAGMFALRYRLQPISETDFQERENTNRKALKKFGFDLNLGVGFRERGSFGGPRSPVYFLGLAGTYHTNRISRLLVGSELEFNRGAYLFGKHVGEFDTEREARLRSMRFSLYAGEELHFGNFSMSLQAGLYLHKVYLGIFPVYNRFIVRYFFPPVGRPAGRFYAAIQLKSHLIIAEYFSLTGGIRF